MRVCLFSSRVAAALVASQLIREGKKTTGKKATCHLHAQVPNTARN